MKANKVWIYFFILQSSQVWARAGGGGGGHSSGGGHSFGGGGFSGGFPGGGGVIVVGNDSSGSWLFTLIFILVVLYLIRKYASSAYKVQDNGSPELFGGMSAALPEVQLPDGSSLEFRKKAGHAFKAIQAAWSAQRLDVMRRFITDGVYQRFHAQFTMMKLLGQENPVTNVLIRSVRVVKYSVEGNYECADVEITAEADDQFICQKFPNLNSPGGREAFTEFWSFIRRRDHQPGLDIFHSEACPKCAAPLTEKLIETARCPYCGVYINSGEFDWVLSNITQSEDYGSSLRSRFQLSAQAGSPLEALHAAYPTFSKHVLEDRASNAFLQILIGICTHNLKAIQRFATAECFNRIQGVLPKNQIAFNRLYVSRVDFISASIEGQQIFANVGIIYNFHKLDLADDPARVFAADELTQETRVVTLVRTLSDITSKGSVYAGSCPQCGATQQDSLSPACEYCGALLNDPKLDWIVCSNIPMAEFQAQANA